MQNFHVKINIKSKQDNNLLIMGIPFEKGIFNRSSGLKLTCGESRLPLWWDERAFWSDGSVKWILTHARVPYGENEIILSITESDNEKTGRSTFFSNGILRVDDVELKIGADKWEFITPEGSWKLLGDTTQTDLEDPSEEAFGEVVLLEDSPIAPLLRIKPAGSQDGFIKDQLLRVDPFARRIIWSRRITWNREGEYWLHGSNAELVFGGHFPEEQESILITEPGRVGFNGGPQVQGYPEGRIDMGESSLWVEKAWQRSPLGISRDNNTVRLSFYPSEVRKLGVKGGTSFRHTVHLCCGRNSQAWAGQEVEFIIDPQYLCRTGALGQIRPKSSDEDRMAFPGFEVSFKTTLDGGRLDRLQTSEYKKGFPVPLEEEYRQDKDYFGLQNYGDWPMNWGQYGSQGRRMYSSNEYDTAYVYFQGYAIFGDWRYADVARQSAVHMSDVDRISTSGDMRYHGYSESAENHEHARSTEGDLGHYWVDGYWIQYFLFGDVWAKEAGEGVTRFLIDSFAAGGDDYIRKVWAVCERNLGWPLVVLVSTYEATGDTKILELIKKITEFIFDFTSDPDKVVEEEDDSSEDSIMWWRTAMQDGCKPFMVGVILEGLERYHRITGDTLAEKAILNLAGFLIDNMWNTHQADFTYEFNAFGRGHRDINAQQLIPLFVRGLGYAYEISGDNRFRNISEKAFHACLWTLYDTSSGGKDIGIIGRTLGAYVTMVEGWMEQDRLEYINSLKPSSGEAFEWSGSINELAGSGRLKLVKGTPQYDGNALLSGGSSFFASNLMQPAYSDCGEIEFRVKLNNGSTTYLNQRGFIHMCNDAHTRSCISVISFYTNFHVRFYDGNRKLIEVLEAHLTDMDVKNRPVIKPPYPAWREDEWHNVRIVWNAPGEAVLYMDGVEADRRLLDRAVGGQFTRLNIGYKPGNWKLNGEIELLYLKCGR